MIRGLNPKFGVLKSLLPMLSVFPNFIDARDLLLREEAARAAEVKQATETTLVAAGATQGSTDNAPAQRPDQPERFNNHERGRGRGRRSGRGRGRGRNGGNNYNGASQQHGP